MVQWKMIVRSMVEELKEERKTTLNSPNDEVLRLKACKQKMTVRAGGGGHVFNEIRRSDTSTRHDETNDCNKSGSTL